VSGDVVYRGSRCCRAQSEWITGCNEHGSIIHLLLVGLVEEGCKFIFFFVRFFRRWAPKDDPRDGIVLAAITALGFAGIENPLYGSSHGFGVLVMRSILSTGGHVCYAGLWGYIYASLEEDDGRRRKEALASILLISGTFHGLSNVLLILQLVGAYFLFDIFNLFLVLLAYRYVGQVLGRTVTTTGSPRAKQPAGKPAAKPVPRPLSRRERYRMHYRGACHWVSKHKYINMTGLWSISPGAAGRRRVICYCCFLRGCAVPRQEKFPDLN